MNKPYLSCRPESRRHFLRGLGVSIALPALASMPPTVAATSPSQGTRRGMLLISNNLGVLPKPFFPSEAGTNYALSPYLEALRDFRRDFTVFSGLSHPAVAGGHSTENCFLTGAKDPTGTGFRNTVSLDQFACEHLGQPTRFPSLNLGVNIDKANRSLSWTRDGILLPAEDSPATLYQRLFVQGTPTERQRRLHHIRQRGSVLDAVTEDMRRFQQGLGVEDRDRLDQYVTSVRSLEERLHQSAAWESQPKAQAPEEAPRDILDKAKFFEKFALMLSMAQMALETDSTRIVTLMVDGYATPVFEIDDQQKSINGYHNLSHHGQVKEKLAQLEQVDHRQMGLLNTLLTHFAETKEQGQRLLDRVMVLYGSNMGDANTHDNTNLPILLAGGGFQHGQHLQFNRDHNTPLAKLFVSMLQQLGVETDQFASSTGSLTGLSSR